MADTFTYNTEISNWFNKYFSGITKLEFNENNEVILYGNNITLEDYKLTELPYKIKEVHGNFSVGGDKYCNAGRAGKYMLESLKNCPDVVYGNFSCCLCPNLKSLEYGPVSVHGNYHCNNTGISSLNGIATDITGIISAYANPNLINIEALSDISFKYIDLDLCVDFIYGSPIYKHLQAQQKIIKDQYLNAEISETLTLKYIDTNQLH